ncbi:MAG: hypothetical protein QNK36_18765 [Colwellia sp.]|nr:hypothetical protein [Colwellia sp.]
MEKLNKVRTTLSVTVAGITGIVTAFTKEHIINLLNLTTETGSHGSNFALEKMLILIAILIPALYIMHIFFNWLATVAFKFEIVRRAILKQDSIEGYWLVDNRVDGQLISTGFMHYHIVDEKLKIEGEHFSPFAESEQKNSINSISITADCKDGKYYNHFRVPKVGLGVANGEFISSNKKSIPDSFQVEVVIETSPEKVLAWGQSALKLLDISETNAFDNLELDKRNELIKLMAQGIVVTMEQHGIRIEEALVNAEKTPNPLNYKKILAKKHYNDLIKTNFL